TRGRLRMLRFPVLIKTDRILKKQLGEFVVADTTGALRLSDARLFHCTADCTSGRSIELSVWGGIQSICLTTTQGRQNAGTRGVIGLGRSIAQSSRHLRQVYKHQTL